MAEAVAVETTKKQTAVPELIKNPRAAFQAFETGARGRIGSLIESSNASLSELDHLLERLSKEDWTLTGIRRRIDALRSRAVNARTTAMKRFDEMPGEAVSALASAGRARIQDLTRSLQAIAKRLEPGANAKPGPTNGSAS
jgi:hypothetical protein